ncbi:MAG: glucoamylase family protein [Dermatophilaceae bacterium]
MASTQAPHTSAPHTSAQGPPLLTKQPPRPQRSRPSRRRPIGRDAWRDRTPIRSEVFSGERFEQHAHSLADGHLVVADAPRVVSLLARLDDNEARILAVTKELLADAHAKRQTSPAAEWIVDNFYAVVKHVRQARRDLPPDYFGVLPKLGDGFLAGHPRVFATVWAYVAHTDSCFDPELLTRFVRAYEQRKPLSLGELWAVPISLRLLLVENLRRVADEVAATALAQRQADRVADAVLDRGHDDPATDIDDAVRAVGPLGPFRPFAVQLMRRLAGQEQTDARAWIARRLDEEGLDPEEIVLAEHREQSAAALTARNIFTSLRLIQDVTWQDWIESVSLMEEDLRANAGYAALDVSTRNLYRSTIEQLARGSGQPELDIARAALQWADYAGQAPRDDVGYWLVDDGRRELEGAIGYRAPWRLRVRRFLSGLGLPGYLGALTLTAGVLIALACVALLVAAPGIPLLSLVILVALASVPFSDLALAFVNHRSARTFAAEILPALALRDGVPEELRTLVVIPSLLSNHDEVEELLASLEMHYLANSGGEIYFALVTDFTDWGEEYSDTDDALFAAAVEGVQRLNRTYEGDRFILLHRPRRFNPAEGVWMGWERKRGKLDELNRLLRGDKDVDLAAMAGRLPGPMRYVLTLDSDTRLPREAARRLVGKLAHPLNRARIDPGTGRVIRGYGILQPRVAPALPMREGTSQFEQLFSTPPGMDRYAFAISDIYQDLFGEGSFAGKGIYDVDVVSATLRGRIPTNSLLSHDLLEGNYARSGLVTDVEVVEQYPEDYLVAAGRDHRWTRGDWQLLPWLFGRGKGLSGLGRWKMFDNLRRSLSPIALILAVLFGIATLSPVALLVWFAILVATFVLPPLLPLGSQLLHWREGMTVRSQVSALLTDLRRALELALVNGVFIAHRAWTMADAAVRALYRMVISHRHLLEWKTAAAAARRGGGAWPSYVRSMRWSLLIPALALALAIWRGPAVVAVCLLPILAWALAPVYAAALSRTTDTVQKEASPQTRAALRLIARRTWHFFDTFVTADENHLPPDNYQENPHGVVAHRTSPTNIGLYLLAVVGARDFGWIGLADAVSRIEATLETMGRLDRYRGHIFNWIDTQTLTPLQPRYVSTVDSGNLAGHLIVLAQSCAEWQADLDAALIPRAAGLDDTLDALTHALDRLPSGREGVSAARAAAEQARVAAEQAEAAVWRHGSPGEALMTSARALVEALALLQDDLFGAEAHGLAQALVRAIEGQRRDAELTDDRRAQLARALARVAEAAMREVDQMDFAFLYHRQRHLLSIGYHAGMGELDDSCYDLLASEARLASFLAVAKGDVRTRHWFMLGRGVTGVGGRAVLQSWSGSMFEYLMPDLVMRNPLGSLLDTTSHYVVRRQIEYARERGAPWGVSEAAYNARDLGYTYQYSPFGVPGLGMVRGLADNLVIAPYATGLAAMVDPDAAVANYAALAAVGASGHYGFYESVDFTPERVPDGLRHVVVQCYMSHHQGMTLLAVHNVLLSGTMRRRFHAAPMVRASELLLQERAPRHVPVTHGEPDGAHGIVRVGQRSVGASERIFRGAGILTPTVHHLSNGRFSLTLTPTGGGQLRWMGHTITRWRADRTTDGAGDHLYLRTDKGDVWSATPLPVLGRLSHSDVRLAEDRAVFRRRRHRIRTELEYRLSPESDAMVRRLVIANDRREPYPITVTSYAELVLGRAADDDAHPVFSKMFVRTEFVPELGALVAERRPRGRADSPVWAGHLLDTGADEPVRPRFETDRYSFLGRGRTVRQPVYPAVSSHRDGSVGHVLDPIFSLSHRVVVPPGGNVTLDFWTFAAGSREELVRVMEAHRTRSAYDRVAMLAWTQSQMQMRHLGVSPDEAVMFQSLAGHALYPHPSLQPSADFVAEYAAPQSALWPLAISGDLPIVVVRVASVDDLRLVRQMVKAFEFWRSHRFSVDVVLLNEEATSYIQALDQALTTAAAGIRPRTGSPDSVGRIFVVRSDHHPEETVQALLAAAAVVLYAQRGELGVQMPPAVSRTVRRGADRAPDLALGRAPSRAASSVVAGSVVGSDVDDAVGRAPSAELSAADRGSPQPTPVPRRRPSAKHKYSHQGLQPLLYDNGYGGFSSDGREYVTVMEPGWPTPAPWSNIVANEEFGFIASAEGSGSVWWRNSRDNQITPWHNDPISAPVSEAIYVRDHDTGRVSTPTAAPIDDVRHIAWHGFGYTSYLAETPELRIDLVQFVPVVDAVKIGWLKLTNVTDETRSVTVTSYHDLVLGNDRHAAARHLITEVDAETGALFVRNPWSTQFSDQVVFVDLGGAQSSCTGDRGEFLGPQGTLSAPEVVVSGATLSGRVGPGLDPCAALQQRVEIRAGQILDVRVLLGAAPTVEAARELVRRYRDARPLDVLTEVKESWRSRLDTVQVATPDGAFDTMMNGWLLYQTMSSRILARAAYYQASGAFGFRDQLQDGMSLVLVEPGRARAHLLRAAGRQFVEGDVQHWWLPEDGSGIRTRISDDVVWLAYAAARYIRVTGDTGVLDERVPYLEGELLADDQHESYFTPAVSPQEDTLYTHCATALRHAFRYGVHGLPLIGTGDWNDGMNRVGERGHGESVWLGWFLHRTLSDFLPFVQARHDEVFERECREQQDRLLEALERDGWDGRWYRRGYFDDGTPLGSASRTECRIDGIAQCWAALSGVADPERVAAAMAAVEEHLIDGRDGVAKLFTPPFELSDPDPGYIRSYPPGVRENGGQYTHAATWYVFAYAALGRQDKAAEMFSLLNPINHALTSKAADTYRVEPYVLAADVYGEAPYVGRGGWTWYTGSSGWLYRAGLEAILGLRREAGHLIVRPCLPPGWSTASARLVYGSATYAVEFRASEVWPRRVAHLALDGTAVDGDSVPLADDGGEHHVLVVLEPDGPA